MSDTSKAEAPKVQRAMGSIDDAGKIIDRGPTKVYELLQQGEIESYFDGKRRLIFLDSVYAYVERLREEGRRQGFRTRRTVPVGNRKGRIPKKKTKVS
jgi:excisionase family DNA binding protein